MDGYDCWLCQKMPTKVSLMYAEKPAYTELDKVIGKKTEENRLSVIMDNTDDSNKGPVAM